MTHAAAHDGGQLGAVLDHDNTASDMWADTAYRSAANLALLERRGLRPQFQRKKNQRQEDAHSYRSRKRHPSPRALAGRAYAMIGRRAAAAGIATKLGNHSFRATRITAYLKNGGTLEKAAAMANHASTRTTQLYDRRRDELSLDEVERIVI